MLNRKRNEREREIDRERERDKMMMCHLFKTLCVRLICSPMESSHTENSSTFANHVHARNDNQMNNKYEKAQQKTNKTRN